MPRRKYSEDEVKQLIDHYKSELKKLQFQLAEVKDILNRLKGQSVTGTNVNEKATVEVKKENVKKRPPRKRGRKKKRAPYKLSDWDSFLLDVLEKEDRLLTKSELEGFVRHRAKLMKEKMSEDQAATKVTRILHKLGNKRQEIRKYSLSGRGYGYGLNKWFFQTTGKLKRKYMP